MIVMYPTVNKSLTDFSIEYYVTGTEYNWFEKLIIGPKGKIYFILALVCGGLIFVAIIVTIILCICRCCKKNTV